MSKSTTDPSVTPVRVFLSWSGESSRQVARALCEGMEQLSDRLEPWLSQDLEPGTEWANTLIPEIKKAKLAVLCLTRLNVGASWISFESGAYYGARLGKGVIPYLLDIPSTELKFPLALFQAASADWTGTKMLFTTIAELVDMAPATAEERFASVIWPQLKDQLDIIRKLQAEAEAAVAAKPGNIANAFYLGHDLRWTMDALSSEKSPKDVKHGVRQVLHQARDLGIGTSNPVLALSQKAGPLLELADEEWTEETRTAVSHALELAFERIGSLVISWQPGYVPYDPENQQHWLEMQAEGRA